MELNKMVSGKIYDPSDKKLADLRLKAHKLSKKYKNTCEDKTKQEQIF